MKAFFLLALALAAVSQSAAYSPNLLLEATNDAQMAMAQQHAALGVASQESGPRVSKMMTDPSSAASEECKKCTMGSAKWVMEHVVEYLKEKCENTTCPKVQEMCEKAEEADEKVVLGYLIAAVRPGALGYAWCNGKGVCGEEDSSNEGSAFINKPEAALPGAIDALLDHSQRVQDGDDLPVSLPSQTDDPDEGCAKCVKATSGVVMVSTLAKIVKYCFKAEKPEAKKMCELAQKHPKETFGYLLYKVRPEEFAYGYCMGQGSCDKKDSSRPSLPMFDAAKSLDNSNIMELRGGDNDIENYLMKPSILV